MTGAATVVVAGGLVWRAQAQGVFRRGQGPAYEPWTAWNTDIGNGPMNLVRAGILAASPHNSQPWLFKVEKSRIDLYADTARNLGAFDPYLREMHIGLGCAVENMVLAAPANGCKALVTTFEERLSLVGSHTPSLVARIALVPAKSPTSILYDAIPHRRTNRAAYDMIRPLSGRLAEMLARLDGDDRRVKLFLFTDDEDRHKIGDIIVNATEIIVRDSQMMHDSDHWFRNDEKEIQTSRDGLTLDCQGFSPLITLIAEMMPAPSEDTSGKFWLALTRDVHAVASPLFGVIAVRDRLERTQCVAAGRLWQRAHLWATYQGLAAQPVNQAVEIVDRERSLKNVTHEAEIMADLIGDQSWEPTFMFRMGFPTREVPPSPRRSANDVLIT